MPKLMPHKVESIRDIVAPQSFDDVQLWLKLPSDATATERFFYENLPHKVVCSRAGGGSYPTLDISIDRKSYQSVLEELKRNARLVHSVIFLKGGEWPQRVVEAYLLQGADSIKTDLI